MDIIFLNKCRAKIISDYGYQGEQIKCLLQYTNQEMQTNYALFSAYEDAHTGTIFECVMPIGSNDLKTIPYYNPMKVMSLVIPKSKLWCTIFVRNTKLKWPHIILTKIRMDLIDMFASRAA